MPLPSPLSFFPVFNEDIFLNLRPYIENPKNPLEAHWHEVVASYVFYQSLQLLSPIISKKYFGKVYSDLPAKTKVNFDIHLVSMVQCVISILAIIPMWNHPYFVNLKTDPELAILGQYPYGGFVAAITVGYFVWDFYVCVRYFHLFGVGFLVHGVAALYVFGCTLYPFSQPWIPAFLLFELSTPFVNINWFALKLPKGTFSDKVIVINGLLLMITFFFVRIIWGFYAVFLVAQDMYVVLDKAPKLFPISILTLNTILNCLNIFWFYKMVRIARKQMAKKTKAE